MWVELNKRGDCHESLKLLLRWLVLILRKSGVHIVPRLGTGHPGVRCGLQSAGVIQARPTHPHEVRERVTFYRDGGPTRRTKATVHVPVQARDGIILWFTFGKSEGWGRGIHIRGERTPTGSLTKPEDAGEPLGSRTQGRLVRKHLFELDGKTVCGHGCE